jgi:hypothetical protein
MKKIIILSILLVFVQLLKAQPSYSFSGGIKLIKPDSRVTTLWYVDESPSMDNLYKSVEQEGNLAYNISARWQNDNIHQAFHLFVEGQGYFGSINGLALNTGLFYRKNFTSKFIIQPELAAVLGFSSKGMGEIQNNDVYIQVNDTRFQDYTNVNVAMQNIYYGIKPGLGFIIKTGSVSEIGFGVNYQLSIKSGMIAFSGIGQDGNSASDSESLNEPNVGFYVDGVQTDVIPYNPDGLEFKVFYSF